MGVVTNESHGGYVPQSMRLASRLHDGANDGWILGDSAYKESATDRGYSTTMLATLDWNLAYRF